MSPTNFFDARLARIEVSQDAATKANDITHERAQKDRDRMQDDIDALKQGQNALHDKIDAGFSDVKAMISADRVKAGAVSGAIALAKWIVGTIAAFAGAGVALVIYWLGRQHGAGN